MVQDEQLRVAPASPGEVPEGARVRHFDELDERAQQDLFAAVHGGSSLAGEESRNRRVSDGGGDVTGLVSGDVVVFTGYYRVR
ncbi:MAG: hypothetical protein ABEJ74_02675 [Haloferacaceae archaeon]